MSRPRLLDLFCGAGGAAVGYHRAGFDVVGVDVAPQKNYPFEVVQADALDVLRQRADDGEFALVGETRNDGVGDLVGAPLVSVGGFDGQVDEDLAHGVPFVEGLAPSSTAGVSCQGFDAIHASPPCQAFTAYRRTGNVGDYPDLIAETRDLLNATDLPWVMENVAGAPLHDPLMLCGSMFDLDVQRHRYFETSVPIDPPVWPCRHRIWAPDRFPGGRSVERTGSSRGLVRACVEIGSWDIPLDVQQRAMGIDWMTLEELSEAIPPTYSEFIGQQLAHHLQAVPV